MSRPSNPSVFISYAWRDDQPFVERLYNDLQRLGYDPWMDKKNMPSRGRSLPREVEEQIEKRDRVVAVIGPDALASEACRAERAFTLSAGKVVTVILRLGDYRMLPPELSQYFVPDFREPRPYEVALDELQRVLQDPPVIPGRLFDVPALPPHLQHRPDELRALRESVTAAELTEATVITSTGHVGLQGMGGVGKTVMAALAARDYTVRRQFQNGIIWLSFGREPNVLREVKRALAALGDDGATYDDVSLARMQLGQALEGKECLLILDDVWSAADAEPFVRAINPRCRLLITTRNLEVVGALGARAHPLDVLTMQQSRDLLARQSGLKPDALPPEFPDLIQECGRLPLALAMIGAMLRGKPVTYWRHVGNLLRHADLERIKAQFPDYPHTDLLRAIGVSVEALGQADPTARERYLALAVLLEDMPIPPVIQQTLWGADELEALATAEQFVSLSLAQRAGAARHEAQGDGYAGSIRLHDLQLDYVRKQHPDQQGLDLIRGAVRLSSNVIERDPGQFASQLVGRLLSYIQPEEPIPSVQEFASSMVRGAPRPWLRPLHSALDPPGTVLSRTLSGHSSEIRRVVMSRDGRRAVSASDDCTLRVWELESGRELHTLYGHKGKVWSVALSGDERRAVSASWDKTLKVWDLETGQELRTLRGHSGSVLDLAISGDGQRAVSMSEGKCKTLKVWDLDTGCELHTLTGHRGRVEGVAVSSNGRRAVSASKDRTLKVWDLETGRELHTLSGHKDWVCRVAISRDGRRAVSASADYTLKVWDLETGRELHTLRGHSALVNEVVLSVDGGRAVSASYDQTLKVWDLESGRELRTLAGHSDTINGVALSSDGQRVVSASDDKTLKVWGLETGAEVLSTLSGHWDWVLSVAVSEDGGRAVSASKDGTLKVWDLETLWEVRALPGHPSEVNGVAVSGDGQRAVSASWDGMLKVWDLETGRAERTLLGGSGGDEGRLEDVAVTANARRAVSASYDKTLKVWDLKSGRALRTLSGHTSGVNAVAVSGDGRRAVSASTDCMLKVWDLETGRELHSLRGHSAAVEDVVLNTDEGRAVSASLDETLKVWDLETGSVLRTLEGHSLMRAVAVTADQKWAVSGSNDGTVKVWDLETGGELRTLYVHSKWVSGVAVSPDGCRAVSASGDRTLKVWDLETGAVVTTFTCDAAVYCCAFAGARRIVAGDAAGRVHSLSLEL